MTGRFIRLLAGFTSLLFMGWSDPAYAYLDPGTGSLIVQSIIGGIVGALATVGLYWRKVKSFFLKKGNGKPEVSGNADQE